MQLKVALEPIRTLWFFGLSTISGLWASENCKGRISRPGLKRIEPTGESDDKRTEKVQGPGQSEIITFKLCINI